METNEVADLRVSQECPGWRKMTWTELDMETMIWVQQQEPVAKTPLGGSSTSAIIQPGKFALICVCKRSHAGELRASLQQRGLKDTPSIESEGPPISWRH